MIYLFQLEDNFFTIWWWFLPYINMNDPGAQEWPMNDTWCTCVPPTWTPIPPFSPPIPLGCPRALALSALLHSSNSHWSSALHMVIYMFQYYSLKSSHPPLLLHRPKVCSLHLCLFCCLAYRIIVTIFQNSIYICVNILY